jgi:hypothetical protein
MDIRQIVEETLVAPMRAMAALPYLTVTQEQVATDAALNEMRLAGRTDRGWHLGSLEVDLVLKRIDRLQMLADAYRRVSSEHEDMVSDLLKLLDNDDLDGARDLVKAKHMSIHGPRD